MTGYEQESGTSVDAELSGFEYEQRSGTDVDIELSLDLGFAFGADVVEDLTIDGEDVSELTIDGEKVF